MIRSINLDLDKQEGYVVRTVDSFAYEEFNRSVSKWVRKDHVVTDDHWMHQAMILNTLKE